MTSSQINSTISRRNFFPILIFSYYLRNEPVQNFFSNLTIFSRASSVDATHEGVTPFALAHYIGLPHAQMVMWHHVDTSRVGSSDATGGPATFCHVFTSRASPIGTTGEKFKPRETFFLSSLFFLSLFSLLSPTACDRRRRLLPCRRTLSLGVHSPPTPVLDVPNGTFSLLTEYN
jgi:hypothetical protein